MDNPILLSNLNQYMMDGGKYDACPAQAHDVSQLSSGVVSCMGGLAPLATFHRLPLVNFLFTDQKI